MGVGIAVPLVMDGKVGNHAFGNKKLPAVVPDKVGLLLWGNIPRYGKHQSPGKLGVPLFFYGFGGVPQGIAVCVLRRGVGRQHDFGVDDFAFMGIVFLFLVVFGKQPFPALVGGGSDGRLAFAALDDFQVKVRAWWHDRLWPPFSRRPGIEKAGNRSMISCSVVPPVGGWYSVLKVRVNQKFKKQINDYSFCL